MKRKAYLEFRKGQKDNLIPAIIYDEYWTDYRTQKHHSPTYGPYDVSKYVGSDGEVTKSFAALTKEFLPLQMQQKSTTIDKEREYQMAPRAATGFLASDNKFFETEEECDFYEQSLELGKRIQNATSVVGEMASSMDKDSFIQQFPKMTLDFIKANEEVIYAYIKSKRELEFANRAPAVDELVRSSADDTSTTDTSLRDTANSNVDTPAETENDTSAVGTKSSSKKAKSGG